VETARNKLENAAAAGSMLEPEDLPIYSDEQLDAIYRRSPVGAFALAGISTLLVFLLWLLFYVFVFLPRGMLK
jgi:hypothetical protein